MEKYGRKDLVEGSVRRASSLDEEFLPSVCTSEGENRVESEYLAVSVSVAEVSVVSVAMLLFVPDWGVLSTPLLNVVEMYVLSVGELEIFLPPSETVYYTYILFNGF